MEEKILVVDGNTPVSSDELVSDLKSRDAEMLYAQSPGKTESMTPAMIDQLMRMWSSQRRGKHSTARSQRAKARIAKRKSKR